ncbi:MAG: GNAT family N-acetyltransferase [Candidatus Eisenbacteria bacterium]
MMTIRKFKKIDGDYRAVLDILNALWPDERQGLSELKYEDEARDPKYTHERYVGEVDGKIVASGVYAHCNWSHVPGKYLVSVDVHPDYQRQGHGGQFFDFLMDDLGKRDADTLVTWTRDDKPDYASFITKRGFEFSMRYAVSRLDVEALDLSEFEWTPGKMKELGVEIQCLTELAEIDPEWKRAWYDIAWELFQDVPSVDEVTRPTFENWCKRFESPGYRMNLHWFARDGDQLVGYTGLWLSEADPAKIYTGLTGVVRSHRRKGIATALKVHGFSRARELGKKSIETDNEEKNPMFDLNMRLGFKPAPAWTEYRRPFADVPAESQAVEASEGA